MRSDPGSTTRYIVRISRQGANAFGWEICREADSIVVHRSTRSFATRIDAILDSARTAAALSLPVVEPAPTEDKNRNRD